MKKKYIFIVSALLVMLSFITILVSPDKIVFFKLIGNKTVNINMNDTYKDLGYSAKYCNNIFRFICKNIDDYVVVSNDLDNNIVGKYHYKYSINFKKYKKELKREINVKDIQSPIIKLKNSNIDLCPNKKYIEDGYVAYDNLDGDITDKVVVREFDNKIYYSVKDSSNNKKIVYRTINYLDNVKPVIKLTGSDTKYLFLNQDYKEEGYEVSDNCDNLNSDDVIVTTNFDNTKTGDYKIIYSVKDSSGNESSIERNIIVYNDSSNIPKNGKYIYLTFDDGPGVYTKQILDILDKYNVKATFFVTNQFSEYKDLIRDEYNKGHSIGVHTYSHNYKNIYSTVDNYINDFNNMNNIIFEETGVYSKLFRFPGGSSNTISKFNKGIMSTLVKKMNELGYYYYDWNIDSGDTSTKDPTIIANNVINEVVNKKSSVVLMHDIKKANLDSLDLIITTCLNNGYTFLPISEDTTIVHHRVNN